jgi:cell division protein FtsZ
MMLDQLVQEPLLAQIPEISSPGSSREGTAPDIPPADILVIGIGSAGSAVIGRLHHLAGSDIRTLVIDSDTHTVRHSHASSGFHLNHSFFSCSLGLCGGDPDLAGRNREAARNARPAIEPLLENPELCFIVAGMGGSTGSGASPIIARMMRERGAVVTAIVTSPFGFEVQRKDRAGRGVRELEEEAHTVLVLEFEKLKTIVSGSLVLPQLYAVMDHIIASVIRNIWESTRRDWFISFDRGDLHSLLSRGGAGTLLLGEFEKKYQNRICSDTMRLPLGEYDTRCVKFCILHISGGTDLGLYESEQIMLSLIEPFRRDVEVIHGASVRKGLEGTLRVFTIVAGLNDRTGKPDQTIREWLDGS